MTDIKHIIDSAIAEINALSALTDLETCRVKYLGKKGEVTLLLKTLGKLPAAERPKAGEAINLAKVEIQNLLSAKKQQLEVQQLSLQLKKSAIDVTLPGASATCGSLHPITRTINRMEQIFKAAGFSIAEGPEVETEHYNFAALNIPDHHPARAMHDTFYTVDGNLLRTHTSPVQIRYMEHKKPPIRVIAPGRVYRCDYDLTHTPMFHQIEGLVIDNSTSFANLKAILKSFLQQFFEDETLKLRFRASYFPFTEPSAEVDITCVHCHGSGCRVCGNSGWLEVLGCGMVHPQVLQNVNLNPEEYCGYAFGVGVERMAMLRYQVDDLRIFFENDLRFLKQFGNCD